MEIRPIKAGEIRDLGELWSAAGLPFKPEGRDRPEELAGFAKSNPDLFLGAFSGGRLAGVVIGTDDGRKGWINRLAVHPDFRRTGVARMLLDALEANLRARGRTVFGTLILSHNDPSIALFQAAGYSTMPEGVLYFRKAESQDD